MKTKIRIWLDDMRPKPEDEFGVKWFWYKSVEDLVPDLKQYINWGPHSLHQCELDYISLDNDLDEGVKEGYQLLDWLESLLIPVEFGFHIHTSDPVARERMRAIIERNGWREVK